MFEKAIVRAFAGTAAYRYRCQPFKKWMTRLSYRLIALWAALVLVSPAAIRECRAFERMEMLTAAMTEHLRCYPIELMGMEKQELAVTSRNFCLASVYHQTNMCPLWVTPEGPRPNAGVVVDFLLKAESEGLDPSIYEVDQIAALFTEHQPAALARLDTLLTFNLIKYIHDVSRGQIKPQDTDPALFADAGDIDFEPLETIEAVRQAPDLGAYLASLPPGHSHYLNLKKALQTYRAIEKAGGWPSIGAGKTIRPGDEDERIPQIILRLAVTGDLDPGIAQASYYDPMLKNSITRFQIRYGLAPDGVIGPNTLAAMNIPVSDAIKQIIINMTRWRWQEHDLGEKYVLVNIANFDLTAFDRGREIFSLPVIVGRFQHQTPIFSDRIDYIDLNPYWNVPTSIARNEDLPKLKKDPFYLVKRHVRLYSGWGSGAVELDSTAIDWQNVSPSRMAQFKLRQDPGPWNALGRAKFIFPNKYDVYLHDTPTQNLFSRTLRDFSHGCIRVSDPARLAAFVLSNEAGGWTVEKIDTILRKGRHSTIHLTNPVPVHLTYQTSWVDKSGIIYFNRDVYGRDKKLLKALFNVES